MKFKSKHISGQINLIITEFLCVFEATYNMIAKACIRKVKMNINARKFWWKIFVEKKTFIAIHLSEFKCNNWIFKVKFQFLDNTLLHRVCVELNLYIYLHKLKEKKQEKKNKREAKNSFRYIRRLTLLLPRAIHEYTLFISCTYIYDKFLIESFEKSFNTNVSCIYREVTTFCTTTRCNSLSFSALVHTWLRKRLIKWVARCIGCNDTYEIIITKQFNL